MELSWSDAILAGVGAAVGYLLRRVARDPARLVRLMEIAQIVVRAVEEMGAVYGWDGAMKKSEADRRLRRLAALHGLRMGGEEADTVIEAAVADLKGAGIQLSRRRPAAGAR
ncbi:MAG: phage holin, LLH family [Bacillota bacterium]|nr:phage holin, LLH family [Bacillota bacterium]